MDKQYIETLIKEKPSHFSIILKKANKEFYDYIDKNFIGRSFSEKLYRWLYEDDKNVGKCKECGKDTYFEWMSKGFREFCSDNCVNNSKIIKDRIKNSYMTKYGVENISQLDYIKNKKAETCFKNYGEISYFNTKESREKANDMCIKKYGISSSEVLKSFNWKSVKTKRKKFIDKCFNGKRIDKTLLPLFDYDTYTNTNDKTLKFKCKICEHIFSHHINTWGLPYCNVCNPSSKFQGEVIRYIIDIINNKLEININKLGIITEKQELDVYIPDLKLAIECDGDFWHNIDKKPESYHLNKTKICEEKGIILIHIFENEWNNKKDELKMFLKDIILGCNITEKYLLNNCKVDKYYKIDRSKINKVLIDERIFNIKCEKFPECIQSGQYKVWNCGYLILERK